TLFLDEIGELPTDLQPKLLRVLETRVISRVGGNEVIPVDFRLVAATHRDLRAEIEAGRFREDLYFRLAEARVVVPPLRARPEDIALLARHFVEECAAMTGVTLSVSPEAISSLEARRWPGNVRELRNVIARAAALCQDGVIIEADLAGEGFGFRG